MKGLIKAPIRSGIYYNLLDNSNFREGWLVNQRGYVSGRVLANYEMFIDRWRNEQSVNGYTLAAEGLMTTPGSSFYQAVANLRNGGKYTFAASTSLGLYTASCELTINGTWHVMVSTGTPFGYVRIDDAGYEGVINCMICSDNGVTVYWAALYEGAYTPETLPPYMPRSYATELAECQRYLYQGIIRDLRPFLANTAKRIYRVRLPQLMIKPPEVTIILAEERQDWVVQTSVAQLDNAWIESLRFGMVGAVTDPSMCWGIFEIRASAEL